jgi:hypothetical protein
MSKPKTKIQTEAVTEPAKTTRPNKNTVNGKRKHYQQAANEMRAEGIRNLQSGVAEMQKNIRQTTMNFQKAAIKMHAEGTHNLQSGVAEMMSGIAAMQVSIADQAKEQQKYTKQFYG